MNLYLRMFSKVEVLNIFKFNYKKLKLLDYLSNVKDLTITLTHLLSNEFVIDNDYFPNVEIVRFDSTKGNQ